MLLLHFSPLATFDALGPQLFPSVVCVFFLFFFLNLCHSPLTLPSCLSTALPHSLLFPPRGLWKWSSWLHGNQFYRSPPPPLQSLFKLVQPQPSSPPPDQLPSPLSPPTPFLSLSKHLFDVSTVNVEAREEEGGGAREALIVVKHSV